MIVASESEFSSYSTKTGCHAPENPLLLEFDPEEELKNVELEGRGAADEEELEAGG